MPQPSGWVAREPDLYPLTPAWDSCRSPARSRTTQSACRHRRRASLPAPVRHLWRRNPSPPSPSRPAPPRPLRQRLGRKPQPARCLQVARQQTAGVAAGRRTDVHQRLRGVAQAALSLRFSPRPSIVLRRWPQRRHPAAVQPAPDLAPEDVLSAQAGLQRRLTWYWVHGWQPAPIAAPSATNSVARPSKMPCSHLLCVSALLRS